MRGKNSHVIFIFKRGSFMVQEKATLRPSPTAILNPRLDPIFKAIFTQGTEESDLALKGLITAAIGKEVSSLELQPNLAIRCILFRCLNRLRGRILLWTGKARVFLC